MIWRLTNIQENDEYRYWQSFATKVVHGVLTMPLWLAAWDIYNNYGSRLFKFYFELVAVLY